LPLLANLEERSTYGELDCFLGVGDKELEGNDLTNMTARDVFALFWKAGVLLAAEVLSYFRK